MISNPTVNPAPDYGLPGLIAPSMLHASITANALTASRAHGLRVCPSRNMTIALIAFYVSTAAGADDACDVGIYSASYAKIVSSGATTGKLNGTGIQTISITPTTLVAGTVYYIAHSVGTFGGTAAQLLSTNIANAVWADIFGTTAGKRLMGLQNTAHPLPDPFVPTQGVSIAPMLVARES